MNISARFVTKCQRGLHKGGLCEVVSIRVISAWVVSRPGFHCILRERWGRRGGANMGFSESTNNRLEVNELSSLSQSIFVAEFSTKVLV